MIRHMIKCDKTFTIVEQGHISPLLPIESRIFQITIRLFRIHQCIIPSQSLMLMNIIIEGTLTQLALIEWKLKIGCFGSDLRNGWRILLAWLLKAKWRQAC